LTSQEQGQYLPTRRIELATPREEIER
jgi:hypothetical protein